MSGAPEKKGPEAQFDTLTVALLPDTIRQLNRAAAGSCSPSREVFVLRLIHRALETDFQAEIDETTRNAPGVELKLSRYSPLAKAIEDRADKYRITRAQAALMMISYAANCDAGELDRLWAEAQKDPEPIDIPSTFIWRAWDCSDEAPPLIQPPQGKLAYHLPSSWSAEPMHSSPDLPFVWAARRGVDGRYVDPHLWEVWIEEYGRADPKLLGVHVDEWPTRGAVGYGTWRRNMLACEPHQDLRDFLDAEFRALDPLDKAAWEAAGAALSTMSEDLRASLTAAQARVLDKALTFVQDRALHDALDAEEMEICEGIRLKLLQESDDD